MKRHRYKIKGKIGDGNVDGIKRAECYQDEGFLQTELDTDFEISSLLTIVGPYGCTQRV